MGQNPVPPVNIPIPTKIGSKMGGAPTNQNGTPLVLTGQIICLWVKTRYQNGTLVSGNMDQNLRSPGGLLLTHTHFKPPPSPTARPSTSPARRLWKAPPAAPTPAVAPGAAASPSGPSTRAGQAHLGVFFGVPHPTPKQIPLQTDEKSPWF